ncbi:Similar to E3 ubiquitin-protein ligase mind-bomb; acc. no. Q9VUX2 [Pyronema omphalodes CBS 100304]|uniref:Similar to E3 ubiquitin-protein ligase mind-bomb acc. no. Q9VUX2 n=1 Tax=Pyronema omphalodes (strain CBS 100304) TaxID=1076935 RepID=U4LQM8_PYROM|nr:Similar to E3 ubiquitin-protein ligase mind-bomb; acc. no. Q9VUX2 [Pyronema omphalodes CBS 100304]
MANSLVFTYFCYCIGTNRDFWVAFGKRCKCKGFMASFEIDGISVISASGAVLFSTPPSNFYALTDKHPTTTSVQSSSKAAYPPSILDELDGNGFTVLHLAAKNGHHRAIQCLLAHGASVDLRDRLGRTSFHIAAAHGYAAAVEVLSQTCDVKALDFTSSNALHRFFNFRHPAPVNTSLDFLSNRSGNGHAELGPNPSYQGPNMNPRQNQSFTTALHESAINSYRSTLESFLNTTNTPDSLLNSRLRSLLSTSVYEFFNYHNPEPNSISDYTNRALVLDVLLDCYKCKLDVDTVDGKGFIALGLVAQRGKRLMGMKERAEYMSLVNAVGKLLGYGADVMKVNEQDRGWVTEVGAEFWWSLADMHEGSRAEIERVRREMMAGFRGGMEGSSK